MRADENRRDNPEINRKVKEMLDQRAAVMDEIGPLLDELLKLEKDYPYSYVREDAGTSIDMRVFDSLRTAKRNLETSLTSRGATPKSENSTYVRNLSAFRFGEIFSQK